ncbi:hypothetical protein BDW59DRAFT_172580 [Aspergillus cavernicola]|uniref:CFEM domain-containing protein n=1 Tax=Aspergillus cavernicola TaxID=176166 RepID=A0ABR4IBI4_9EURO
MDGFPACGLACLTQAIRSSSCSLLDIDCICHNEQLITQIQACGVQNCTIKDNLRSMNSLYTTCEYPVEVNNKVFAPLLIVLIILSSLAVTLRIVGRLIGSKLGLDDGAMLLTLAITLALTILTYFQSAMCLGKDIWTVPFDTITKFIYQYYVCEILYVASITFSKISMLLLFLRLFQMHFRLANYLALAFTVAWGLALFLALVFSCQPISYFWTMWDGEHEGECTNNTKLVWAHACTNIFLDVVIIGLPMPTLFQLTLSWRRKVGVCMMFAVGIVVTIVSILRFMASLSFDMTDNPTKNLVIITIWSVLETHLSIICACMPGIRAFFNYTRARLYPKPSLYDFPSTGANFGNGHGISNLRDVGCLTLKSANREQGEFIRLQETD